MTTREYIGARYVPKFKVPLEHDPNIAYEPLTVVTSGAGTGDSYISRCYIEAGVQLTDPRWVLTYNYDAQVYALEQTVQQQSGRIDTNATAIAERLPLSGGTMTGKLYCENSMTFIYPPSNPDKTLKIYNDYQIDSARNIGYIVQNDLNGIMLLTEDATPNEVSFYIGNIANGDYYAVVSKNGISAKSKKISQLATPTAETDAANKKYVDDNTTNKLPLAGGTMTGDLNMSGKKITNIGYPNPNTTDCATTAWVKNGYLPFDGTTQMTGSLQMGSHKISQLAAPTAETDAANKKYVDDLTKLSPAAAAQGWQTIKLPTGTAKKFICIQLYTTTVNKSVTKATDVNIYLTDILLAHKAFPKAYDNPPYEFCTIGAADLDNAWAVKANANQYPTKTQTGDYRGFTTVNTAAKDWTVKYMAVGIVTEA